MKKLKLKLIAITVATMTTATLPSVSASAAWKQNEGNWNYLSDSGELKTGWVNDNGAWYYLDNSGAMKTGWINDNGTWYYSNNSGAMKTGWVNDNGAWYYLNNSGAMKTGWVNDNGAWYYLNNSGAMKTGWINDNGTWYFSDVSGVMQTGVVQVDGKTYSLNAATGAMQVGNITINGKTYAFAQSGEAIGDSIPPSKSFNSAGVKLTNTSNKDTSTSASNQQESSSNSSSNSSNNNSNKVVVNKAVLTNVITATKTKYTVAVEGTDVGQYAVGSKATFKTAIDAAQTVVDNVASTQKDIDLAVTALTTAMTTFDNSCNKEDINAGVSTNYLEDYREQYHFSVAKAWANDPNGMVYFNGEYHLFYQYYPDDVVWGPMHWGHAVSKDLIHWEELGTAIAPDGDIPTGDSMNKDWYKYGENWIYSGCAVVDKDNTSGFFDGIEGGGLVAVYTQHIENPRTEQQAIAYSRDNGKTWIKPTLTAEQKNLVLTSAEDPLNRPADFRDPKIVYMEDSKEWLMVTAGGPLRIFSSKNLIDWKPEAMQPEITTECPDIFKLEVGNTGTYKWVLSEGGRYYRVGDLKKVDGVWKFVSDEDQHLPMNFVKDSYAAQTYYGTGENGTPDGRRIMINWMNNWDYCNAIAPITKTFNGQFTLQTELKLAETADGVRMIQQPIKEYETLRQAPTTFENVKISPDKPNIMSNLSGSQYEIVGEFEPTADTTEFGFKLRVGEDAGQETIVKYTVATGEVTLDRTKSGQAPNNFLQSYSSKISKTSDGKIQLQIFVDASSVEVYGNNGEVTGSAQIFPNRSSEGIEVYSLGGDTNATINYYPIKGIWNNDIKGTNSVLVSLSEGKFTKEVGEQFSIFTTIVPTTAAQGVNWLISNPDIVKIVSQDEKKTTFEVTKIGSTNLTATSKDGKSTATSTLSVHNRIVTPDISNLTNFKSFGGNWYVENGIYIGDGAKAGDAFATSDQKNDDLTATYTFTADAKLLDGGDVAALTLFSKEKDPFKGSIVANIIKNGDWRVFNFPAGQNVASGHITPAADNIYHLKAELKGKHIRYWINDVLLCDADQNYYDTDGYFGLNVCNAKVEYTNVFLKKVESDKSKLEVSQTEYYKNIGEQFTIYTNQAVNYTIDSNSQTVVKVIDGRDSTKTIFEVIGTGEASITATPTSGTAEPVTIKVTSYETNPDGKGMIEGLSGFTTTGPGRWYVDGDAYVAEGGGDKFAISNTNIEAKDGDNYTFETDATVLNPDIDCAPSLVLFSKTKDTPNTGSLVFNINPNNGAWRIFEFGGSYGASGNITPSSDGKYNLKVDIVGQTIKYFINGTEVCSTPNFTQRSGYVGLMSWNANVEFRNTVFKSVDPSATLGITTSYENIKGEEFTINANQSVTYTSSDPAIVDVISGNGSNATTFIVNEAGITTINAVSDNNPELQETITVTGLETDPITVLGLVDGLSGFDTIGGKWYVKDGAYVSEGSGDKFAISDNIVNVTTGAACTFSTNATIKSDGAAALILSNDKENPFGEGSIIANVNRNGEWRIFRFPECDNLTDIDGDECRGNLETVPDDGVYTLKLEVNGTEIEYYINDELVATIDASDYGFENSYVGLMNWNAKIEFRDTKFTE